MKNLRRSTAFCLLATLLVTLLGSTAGVGEAVRVENATEASRCAEDDNVYVKFIGARITHFTVEARHPTYIAAVVKDSTAPDFTACDQSHDPSYSFTPLDLTLFEDADYKLIGRRFSRFWRPGGVGFRVFDQVWKDLHLVQLIRKLPDRNVEILVVYPLDGYWRMKPLPPAGVADTAYGSSFLVGPIQEQGRPYVALSSIEFVPSSLSFRLSFKTGEGVLRIAEASSDRTRVDVSLPPSTSPIVFAALRSMFVSRDLSDTAEATLDLGAGPSRHFSILDFPAMDVTAVTFGRSVPSRHNTSAPDLSFGDFARRQ